MHQGDRLLRTLFTVVNNISEGLRTNVKIRTVKSIIAIPHKIRLDLSFDKVWMWSRSGFRLADCWLRTHSEATVLGHNQDNQMRSESGIQRRKFGNRGAWRQRASIGKD